MTYLASKDEKVVICVLETLEAILVDSSENMESFEQASGLGLVCSILQNFRKCEEVTHKCIELFTIYLGAETGYPDYLPKRQQINKKLLLIEFMGRPFAEQVESLARGSATKQSAVN